jgi:RimJ/RimL family protein N-acetyltransferase
MAHFLPIECTLTNGSRLRLRSLQPTDASASIALRKANAHDGPYLLRMPDEVSSDVDAAAADYQRSLSDPGELSLGAFAVLGDGHEQLVGLLRCVAGGKRRIAHVGNIGISVALASRGTGVGTRMLHACIAWACEHPVLHRLTLEVVSQNTGAKRLYERMGFVVEGVRPRQIQQSPGVFLDDEIMGLWLDDVRNARAKPV